MSLPHDIACLYNRLREREDCYSTIAGMELSAKYNALEEGRLRLRQFKITRHDVGREWNYEFMLCDGGAADIHVRLRNSNSGMPNYIVGCFKFVSCDDYDAFSRDFTILKLWCG